MSGTAKPCILYEDRDVCIECSDCRCDLDPEKICDNCMRCERGEEDYRAIRIEGIRLNEEPD